MREVSEVGRFEGALLPHLDAAYNLARWLMRNSHDAEDVVQESYLRALKSFRGFHGQDGRAWLLMIVRNTCYTALQHDRTRKQTITFDEARHSGPSEASGPEMLLAQKQDVHLVHQALAELPVEFREVIVLRELEGLSYKEIAAIADIPIGTVMSRLARAREKLQECLASRMIKE